MAKDKSNQRGFGAIIAAEVLASVKSDPPAAADDFLEQRGAVLSKNAGDVVFTKLEWVDPALCRPSPVNARDYQALTYEDCAELIETIKSEGRQRTPATVRPTNNPAQPYEIVAGSRRHWSITWLRANNYPDFKYLIDVQKMDDEAAFRFSDLENRARTDISDLERGRGYLEALAQFYHNDRNRMAERIGISLSQLNRYILLAKLDEKFVEAIGGHRAAKVVHARDINAALKRPHHTQMMMDEASLIISEQIERKERGEKAIQPGDVVKRLIKSTTAPKSTPEVHRAVPIASASGQSMIEFTAGNARTAATIKLLPATDATREEMKKAVSDLVDQFFDTRAQK